MKKKGAGARRAVCGVLRPRVFQTATDAHRLVVVRLRGWENLPVVYEPNGMTRRRGGESEKKRGNSNYKEGIMNGSHLQIPGRRHLHCTLLSHAAFLSPHVKYSTIAPLPAGHRARTTSAPCRQTCFPRPFRLSTSWKHRSP